MWGWRDDESLVIIYREHDWVDKQRDAAKCEP